MGDVQNGHKPKQPRPKRPHILQTKTAKNQTKTTTMLVNIIVIKQLQAR